MRCVLRAVSIEERLENAANHLENALFLVHAFEQLTPHAVDGLPLLVHHVVIFEDVFARREVLGFDCFLRGCNAFSDEARLNRHIFFHAEPQHQALHAIAAEDAQQIVLQRQIKARTAGIALASGASAKLVVDAARFVPLSADDVQPAERHHFLALLFDLVLDDGEFAFQLLLREHLRDRCPASSAAPAARKSGIAAEQNIGTAAGHIGRNGDRAFAARLRDDGSLTLVILRVQHFMPERPFSSECEESRSDFSTEMVPTRTGRPFSFHSLISLRGVAEFFFFGAEHDVGIFIADHRPVGGNYVTSSL